MAWVAAGPGGERGTLRVREAGGRHVSTEPLPRAGNKGGCEPDRLTGGSPSAAGCQAGPNRPRLLSDEGLQGLSALLGDHIAISASLLYPREPLDLQLDDPEAALAEIKAYLQAARAALASGAALSGPDTGGDYDDLAFALPANAGATYCKRKLPAATEIFGDAAHVWEAR